MRFGALPVAARGVAALSMVVLAQQPSAQPPPPSQQPTFKSGTQVVSLFVTVADAQKRLVPGLTQEDFEVYDNDKPQPIVYFAKRLLPIKVVVISDTSGSTT